ncbi:MAG: acyltransferase family protein [Rothia sp. (in: high G+C Gram-positive bacteria)]|nr:acyltransferase family protein [Rothia sp. (in: high G+C Gram-positive bacteria)]
MNNSHHQPAAPSAGLNRFRPEIQGLRAFAVTLVAIYHFWFGKVSGGVDIFLLISAFLMTLSFTRKIESGQRVFIVALVKYWVHTFKRILPLATLTVLGVLWGTRMFLPAPRWPGIMDEAQSVILYRENWWSIKNMVDYYAADSSAASPLRHFWSLSVQGQIFILWPLLFALCWVLFKIFRRAPRLILGTVFGAVFIASLTYSIHVTHAEQATAYFNTWARLWEFALGSLLAIFLPMIRVPQRLKIVLGWLGLVAILTCGLVLDVQGQFPGYIALWPTLAAAAVILSGGSGSSWGVDHFLSRKPFLWLGKYSYGLYLIHWPLLVFYLYNQNREKAGFLAGIVLFVLSVALSWIITNLVERPLRAWKWLDRRIVPSLAVIACCMIAVNGVIDNWQERLVIQNATLKAQPKVDNPGAQSLLPGFTYRGSADAGILPLSAERFDDRPIYGHSCPQNVLDTYHFASWNCNQLVVNSNPTKRVIAVGNSHMDQWGDNLIALAKQENWDLQFVQFNDCYFLQPDAATNTDACKSWISSATNYIDQAKPDEVITVGTTSVLENSGESVPTGFESFAEHLSEEKIGLIALRDNPRFEETHADCETRTRSLCSFDSELARSENPLKQYSDISNLALVDMTDIICPDGKCPSAIGNVYTYRDNSHITRTYEMSASSIFIDRMESAIKTRDQKGWE